ncbi:protein kinase UbiB [Seminavis robusta]|uniref:Protein kinase UbiB n=1 Tax=Seminavis robusta TaxID=568900 RepID=A0A9N8DWQ5_9STRA|nr:protein kinase UbiB [Seminavis robusta]|eukprot:Sro352_g124140.1 protein kinase UbiB (630) ;mRNA; r:14845-17275
MMKKRFGRLLAPLLSLVLLWFAQSVSSTAIPTLRKNRAQTRLGGENDPGAQTVADGSALYQSKRSFKGGGPLLAWSRIHALSKQVAIHIASGNVLTPTITPRIVCMSGIACALAANVALQKSEAAQRACFFWQKAGPIVAHYKFTQWWLRTRKAPIERRHAVYQSLHNRYCEPCLDLALDLKGLYVKMGQVMSSRADFMPVQYVNVFSTLQDSVPQWPIEDAVEIVRDSLKKEWGVDYDDVFESIDPVALGCAAIGQVHRAELKDYWLKADPGYKGGKVVAVKIMHPDAHQRFACDFQVFKWLTRIALPGWSPLLEELERRLMTEFDYHTERDNQMLVRNNLMKSPYKRQFKIPQPYDNLCCKHVLVMELLDGQKFKDAIEEKLSRVVGGDREKVSNFLAQRQKEIMFGRNSSEDSKASIYDLLDLHGIRGVIRAFRALALYRKVQKDIDLLVEVHGHQIFQDAVFNGDPHPGNIMELSDGRLGLIDFGQTKKLDDNERLAYARIVNAVGSKADSHQIAEAMRAAGFQSKLDEDDTLAEFAGLFFDSDFLYKEKGHDTPQDYFQSLMESDPLTTIPDAAIMVARVSILFRGAGTAINHQVQTSNSWRKHAHQALEEASRHSLVTDAEAT